MPHQCVRCNTFYDDGASEILKGCKCGGKLFFFIKKDKLEEAKTLARNLNQGALPVPINLISQRSVGGTLGFQELEKSLFSGLIGFVIISLFMIFVYRLGGFFSVIALIVYAWENPLAALHATADIAWEIIKCAVGGVFGAGESC